MIKTEQAMITLFFKATSYMLKFCLAWLGTLTLFQNVDYEIFKALADGVLSVTARWIGFLYLVFIVSKKGVDLWEHWRKARYRVKEEAEKYKQSKIETRKQDETFKDKKNEN